MSVHFSSRTADWPTPPHLFDQLAQRYGPFDLDVCASERSAKCERYYTEDHDGLTRDWFVDGPRCWMNPPYGRVIGRWMEKALTESRRGCLVVCLVPARTDTAWWHDHAMQGRIEFIRGRVKFVGARYGAPFPSAVVVFP